MPRMQTNSTPPAAIAAIAALVLCVVVTWPVVLYPNTLLMGHPGNDNWNHVWGYWWVAEAVKIVTLRSGCIFYSITSNDRLAR